MGSSCRSHGTAPTSTCASYRSGNTLGSASIYEHRKKQRTNSPARKTSRPLHLSEKCARRHLNGTRAARSIIAFPPIDLAVRPGRASSNRYLHTRIVCAARTGERLVIRGREEAQRRKHVVPVLDPAQPALGARVSHSTVYSPVCDRYSIWRLC
jgi:hypothetical protein